MVNLPVDGIHIDCVRAPEQLGPWVNAIPSHWVLSAGVIDGRNIWRNDLDKTLALLTPWVKAIGRAFMASAKLFIAAYARDVKA